MVNCFVFTKLKTSSWLCRCHVKRYRWLNYLIFSLFFRLKAMKIWKSPSTPKAVPVKGKPFQAKKVKLQTMKVSPSSTKAAPAKGKPSQLPGKET